MSERLDTIKARKHRLELIRKYIEQATDWTPYENYIAFTSMNIGIRPQVADREFKIMKTWLANKLETRMSGNELEFRFNGSDKPKESEPT